MDPLDADAMSTTAPQTSVKRRPRTSEDFYLFCKIILEHENFENNQQEDLRYKTQSPMDSVSSTTESTTDSPVPDPNNPSPSNSEDSDIDMDSYNFVSCYCSKPYAGRPMIECSQCLTWLHLSCAKVKRNNIPKFFYCYKCKEILGVGGNDLGGGGSGGQQQKRHSSHHGTASSNSASTTSASTTTQYQQRYAETAAATSAVDITATTNTTSTSSRSSHHKRTSL